MVRPIDARRPRELDPSRRDVLRDAAREVSDRVLPGAHRIHVESVDPTTGNAAVVTSQADQPQRGEYVARALRHVQRIGPALGFGPAQAPEFAADPMTQETSTGAVAVHLRQLYKGIPVYDGASTVRFDTDGALLEVAGRSVTVDQDLPVSYTVSAERALRIAAAHVAEPEPAEGGPVDVFGEPMVEPGLDLSGFAPQERTSGPDRPDQPATFDAPPFEHVVTVALQWFPMPDGLRLAWHTKLAVPGGAVYRILVDANDEQILLAARLTRDVAGTATVVLSAGGAPQQITMPRQPDAYGLPMPGGLPAGFPDHWLVDRSTLGATVHAVVEPGSVPRQGSLVGTNVTFTPATPAGHADNLVVNLFALCSSMHDLLYLLGFREADGNFQSDNHSRGGRAGDPVLARVHPGPVYGTANMGTPPDGSRPTMNMGLVSSTGRHTALDPDVVFHEYTHGLTNRLVGGPLNDAALDAVQSGGMGEGWSDFFACIALGKSVVGDWVVKRPSGIRAFPYTDAFPDDYGDLGTGRYVGDAVHNLGEIWCATLMSLSRRIGRWEAAQVVVDALKLTPANPSFLAARDAILLAADRYAAARLGDSERAGFVQDVWEVFADFGMGPAARTGGAERLTGIVPDFTAPARQPEQPPAGRTVSGSARPALSIPDNDPDGISSTIVLPDAGDIRRVRVSVEITHPYRGDLEVVLVAPDDTTLWLLRRSGGSADDVHELWSSDEAPALAGLVGRPAAGPWTLRVADRAARDVGRLDAWAIDCEVAEPQTLVEVASSPGIAIPDNIPAGVDSELIVAATGLISSLELDLDITHTYVGDLEVTLTGPDGTRVPVHSRTGGGTDNLITTYSSQDGGRLESFVGRPVSGTWQLQVADRAGLDVGKLNRWALRARVTDGDG